jgi:uncharacterized protein YutE (UPF0331/DUF86 family)
MTSLTTEEEVLAREVARLEAEGYDVFIQPRPPHTPPFLGDFLPDAVAIGNGKKLMIEVVKGGLEDKNLRALAEKFERQREWDLKLILVSPTSSGEGLSVQSSEAIQSALHEITALRDGNALRAAYVLAWAALEAEARRLMPNQFRRAQSAGRIVQALGQEGFLTPDEADQVRGMIDIRNRLVHGELSAAVTHEDVDRMLAVLGSLREQEVVPST